jgi:hypothetical protein
MIPKAPQLLKKTHANLIVQTETPVFGNEGIHRIGLCTKFNQHHSYGLWDTRSVQQSCMESDNHELNKLNTGKQEWVSQNPYLRKFSNEGSKLVPHRKRSMSSGRAYRGTPCNSTCEDP